MKEPIQTAQAEVEMAFNLGHQADTGRTLSALRAMLSSPDDVVKDTAAASLGSRGDVASLPILISLLSDGPPRHRLGTSWAVFRLGKRGGADALERAAAGLKAYRKRARGMSRDHADQLLRMLLDPYVPGDADT